MSLSFLSVSIGEGVGWQEGNEGMMMIVFAAFQQAYLFKGITSGLDFDHGAILFGVHWNRLPFCLFRSSRWGRKRTARLKAVSFVGRCCVSVSVGGGSSSHWVDIFFSFASKIYHTGMRMSIDKMNFLVRYFP